MNFTKVLKSLFGDKSSRDMKLIQPLVDKAKSFTPQIQAMSNDELRARTKEIQQQVQQAAHEQKAKIEQTSQAILDARAKYPDCSLADLYDEVTMPPELRTAHRENDRAVMAAYGFSTKMTESECVAELFKLYQNLTK